MSISSVTEALRRSPIWGRVVAGVFALLILGRILAGPESDKEGEAATSPSVATTPASAPMTRQEREEAASAAKHHAAVDFKESIADAIDSDDSPSILCLGQRHCGVTYEIDELFGTDIDEELLEAQRDVWATMFGNPRFKGGLIKLEGTVESVGGKTFVKPVLIVRCDRGAADQIDWENVRAEGFKQLCDWQDLVG